MTMAFLENCWYAAGWSENITRQPLRRIFLNKPVVLYRREDRSPVALEDICPHRFAPLSMGTLCGDNIQCAYHGLQFDGSGACQSVPHGGKIPSGAKVRSYPVVEKNSLIWIWMGDRALASENSIPDTAIGADPNYKFVHGTVRSTANYELLADNLLDLTHVEFLHPSLRMPESAAVFRHEATTEGDIVWSRLWIGHALPHELMKMVWPADKVGDSRAHMRWTAPGIMVLDAGFTEIGADPAEGPAVPALHIVTPETDNTSHYFWGQGRNWKINDAAIDREVHLMSHQTFANEDGPIVEAQQVNLSFGIDIRKNMVFSLPADGAQMRARRVLARLIETEKTGS